MDPIIEKVDDQTIQITTPIAPEVKTINIATLTQTGDNLARQIDDCNARWKAELQSLMDQKAVNDDLIAQASELGVVATPSV